jgi:hypothetical protein
MDKAEKLSNSGLLMLLMQPPDADVLDNPTPLTGSLIL